MSVQVMEFCYFKAVNSLKIIQKFAEKSHVVCLK